MQVGNLTATGLKAPTAFPVEILPEPFSPRARIDGWITPGADPGLEAVKPW
jgi:hypothetical protein